MLGENLKKLRGKRTQEEIAKILGISRARYSHYETETRQPDFKTLEQLANLYNVSIDSLLGRDTSSSSKQISFNEFIEDKDLREWYKKLGQAPEEDLADLKVFYETFIAKKNNK